MSAFRRLAWGMAAFFGVLIFAETAQAQYVLSDYGGVVWRKTYTLANNETLQLQTVGCSGGEDTVMFLLEGTGTGATRVTRAWNDDQGSGFSEPWCSYIFFTNTSGSTKTYEAVAAMYPGTVVATVDVNSWRSSTGWITESSQVNLRGVTGKIWANGTVTHETVGRRQTAGGGWSDTVLYVIDTNIGATSAFDDDGGLGPLSRLTVNFPCSSSTLNCWIVSGLYSQFASPITKFEVWGRTGADADGDGIQDGIETTEGTRTDLKDTDGDGLTDAEELVGVAASSLSGFDSSVIMPWEDTGASPTFQDLFIEIDYMAASDHSHNPSLATNWPNQLNDMSSIFSGDVSFTNRTIFPHVQISDSLTETTYLTFGTCSGADTTNFYTVKNNTSYFNPLRAGIFHYAIWGHLHKANDCSVDNWIGQGEIWGNDVITALGGGTNQVGGTTLQRVNYIHELGHNLSLSHNGNGNSGNANSCVHASVMNYRYSNNGWNNTLRGSGYSQGTCTAVAGCGNTCAANHCVPSNQATVKAGCSSNNGSCDCDRSEWSIVNLDIPASAQMSYSGCQVSNCSNGNLPDEDVRDLFLAGAKKGALHKRLLEARKSLAEQRGLRENVDFKVHPDNGRMYSVE